MHPGGGGGGGKATGQMPKKHGTGSPVLGSTQGMPQPPQFMPVVSVQMLVHVPPQHCSIPLQATPLEPHVHWPPTHISVALQAMPHMPQLALSVMVFTQPDGQQVVPGAQSPPVAAHTHSPPTQLVVSGSPQLRPHMPQLAESVWRFLQPVSQHSAVPVQAGAMPHLHCPPAQPSE